MVILHSPILKQKRTDLRVCVFSLEVVRVLSRVPKVYTVGVSWISGSDDATLIKVCSFVLFVLV